MNVAVRAAREQSSSSGSWWQSLKDESISFFKGDNNAPWAILAETVIGCVPVLGQIVDARDIIKGLVDVATSPASPLAWFNLITALIGLIPGGGDAAKRGLRAVKSGAVQMDDLLATIRRFYKGDPEKLLREVLDVSKLKTTLDRILGDPRLINRLDPAMRKQLDEIRNGLGRQFDAFKKEVDGWLTAGRKTSAETPVARAHPPAGTPPAKPGTSVGEGTRTPTGKGEPSRPATTNNSHSNRANSNQTNAATQRTARFKQLTQKVLGVLGEHMADYHCQEVKGWGRPGATHDSGATNSAKLNDSHHLVQLWPTLPRGRGIDAVWKPSGTPAKPYAVIEAKASYDPTKSLRALLGEAGDKSERGARSGGATSGRGGGTGQRGRGAGNSGSTPRSVRQANGKVTQMSHEWIRARLQRAVGMASSDWSVLRDGGQAVYSRHVLFFSIPQAVSHAEALIKLTAREQVQDVHHDTHQTTREWSDNQIAQVVNDRAGVPDKQRRMN